MDKRIFLTLIAIILLVGTFIGIKAMLTQQCETPEVSVVPSLGETGQPVEFTCLNADENVTWSFGDGKSAIGKVADHRFDSPGKYTVSVKTGESCSANVEVVVNNPRTIETVVPAVEFPKVIYTGEQVIFKGTTKDATGWKWHVKETNEVGEGTEFRTTFKSKGTYTMHVSIDGNYMKGTDTLKFTVNAPKIVTIPPPPPPKPKPLPKPKPEPKPQPKPPPPPPEFMSNMELQHEFKKISNGLASPIQSESEDASDDWVKIITKEVCAPAVTFVELIDEDNTKSTIKLEEFKLQMLNKQHTIKKVEVAERGVNPRCVKKLKVEVTTNIKND